MLKCTATKTRYHSLRRMNSRYFSSDAYWNVCRFNYSTVPRHLHSYFHSNYNRQLFHCTILHRYLLIGSSPISTNRFNFAELFLSSESFWIFGRGGWSCFWMDNWEIEVFRSLNEKDIGSRKYLIRYSLCSIALDFQRFSRSRNVWLENSWF